MNRSMIRRAPERGSKSFLKTSRERLDKLLVARGFAESRERAQGMILAGLVRVKGLPVTKAGVRLPQDAEIEIHDPTYTGYRKGASEFFIGTRRYASRGGQKLEHALSAFAIYPSGWTAMDVGASSGGFTDCLLQHGVSKVFAVDVGYGQLSWRLRQDPRVVVIERTNIRYMNKETVPDAMDLITVDLSFISLRLVLPKLLEFLKYDGRIVALVKPQFEVGKGEVGRGGLVKDPAKHQKVLEEVRRAAEKLGLTVNGITASPISGRKGNQEYFIYLTSRRGPLTSRKDLLKDEATA